MAKNFTVAGRSPMSLEDNEHLDNTLKEMGSLRCCTLKLSNDFESRSYLKLFRCLIGVPLACCRWSTSSFQLSGSLFARTTLSSLLCLCARSRSSLRRCRQLGIFLGGLLWVLWLRRRTCWILSPLQLRWLLFGSRLGVLL